MRLVALCVTGQTTQELGVMHDWAYDARIGRYRLKSNNQSSTLEGTMSQFKKPILGITFDGDKFSPHVAMQATK